MTIFALILLVVFGVLLILLEFFVVPGVTVAGIGGFLMMIGGIYLAYDIYGSPIGHYFLLSTILISTLLVFYALKSDTWKRIMLKSEIKGKVKTHKEDDFHVNDEGITLTRLAPIGRVEVNGLSIEGKSIGPFIDEETEIVVVEVLKNQLIVKQKEN